MHRRPIRLTPLLVAMMALAAASPSGALRPEHDASIAMLETLAGVPGTAGRAPISARVSLGCQDEAGFVARVLAQAGERSASRFALGHGFVAVYRDGSWIHIAELAQPCIVASGRRADMITYFDVE